ncbi:MAG: hypothetical protein MI748_12810, partial [Opitutales bacterium]|nr:hypothetical protein [Opitutales bacterium]
SSDNKEKSDEESKNPEPSANEVADANDTSTSQSEDPHKASDVYGTDGGKYVTLDPFVVDGNKGNTLDTVQTVLDVAGLVPGVGEFADLANALISLGRGNYAEAGLSALAMVPFAGWGATGAKAAMKYGDEALEGAHTVFKTHNDKIIRYETRIPQQNPNNPNPWQMDKRYDGIGGSHYNKATQQDVPTPHIHDPGVPGGVRPANPDEIPGGG